MPSVERPQMSAYGVPHDLEGVLPWSWAEARLAESRNFWLVTVSAAGRPHCLPVWGVWMAERERFGFSCATTARKVRNLAANDQVVVTNDDSRRVVSLEGRAVRLAEDDPAIEAMASLYAAKYSDDLPDPEQTLEFLSQNASYEVIPDRAFGLIETPEDFGPRSTRWSWA